jgi:hypothetical protein
MGQHLEHVDSSARPKDAPAPVSATPCRSYRHLPRQFARPCRNATPLRLTAPTGSEGAPRPPAPSHNRPRVPPRTSPIPRGRWGTPDVPFGHGDYLATVSFGPVVMCALWPALGSRGRRSRRSRHRAQGGDSAGRPHRQFRRRSARRRDDYCQRLAAGVLEWVGTLTNPADASSPTGCSGR